MGLYGGGGESDGRWGAGDRIYEDVRSHKACARTLGEKIVKKIAAVVFRLKIPANRCFRRLQQL